MKAWQCVRAVLDSEDASTSERIVAIALIRRASKTGECSPAVKDLAAQSGLHRVTVHKTLNRIEERGWIKRLPEMGKRNRYKITIHPPNESGDLSPDTTGGVASGYRGCSERLQGVLPQATGGVASRNTSNPLKDPQKKKENGSLFSGDGSDRPEEEVRFLRRVKTVCLDFEVDPEELLSRIQRKAGNRIRDLDRVTAPDVHVWLLFLRARGWTVSDRMLTASRLRAIKSRRSESSMEKIETVIRFVNLGDADHARFLREKGYHEELTYGWFRKHEQFEKCLSLAQRNSQQRADEFAAHPFVGEERR